MSQRSDSSFWLPEDAALDLLGLSRGAGRDLLNKGLLRPLEEGIFREPEIVEATILDAIRPSLGRLSQASNTWTALREEGTIGDLVRLGLSNEAKLRFEVVVDELTYSVSGAVDDEQLLAAIRGSRLRKLVIVDLTEQVQARLTGFRRRANRGPVPIKRRGRPRKIADVHSLPSAADGKRPG